MQKLLVGFANLEAGWRLLILTSADLSMRVFSLLFDWWVVAQALQRNLEST